LYIILSNDQTTGVEKIINNSWTLQRRGICAHAYNTSTKKRKISLCTYNTALGTAAVVRMRNGVIMQITSEESLWTNIYMCLHDGSVHLSPLYLTITPSRSLSLSPLLTQSAVWIHNNNNIIIIIMKHENVVPILYIRGKDDRRECGGPAPASVTRLAADHRYI